MAKKTFPAELIYLHEMLSFIYENCLLQGFDLNSSEKVILATEEALVNVIHHGYPDKRGTIELVCEKLDVKPGLKISIIDKGIPFDPALKAIKFKQEHPQPILDYAIGGYGIYLYAEIMDIIEYQRDNDINILILIKYL